MATSIVKKGAKAVILDILVFGPAPGTATASPSSRLGKLALKRIDICDWLNSEGHNAVFPENIYKKTSNVFGQEIEMMHDFDLIVNLVESPGSNVELGMMAMKSAIARKSHAFIDKSYRGGLADQACKMLRQLDGKTNYFNYPDDLDLCHLKTTISRNVKRLQLAKYLS